MDAALASACLVFHWVLAVLFRSTHRDRNPTPGWAGWERASKNRTLAKALEPTCSYTPLLMPLSNPGRILDVGDSTEELTADFIKHTSLFTS